jgi:hypothetical protein
MRRLVFFLVALAVGCSKQTGTDYFPSLAQGETRHYAITYRTLFGGVQEAQLIQRGEGEERIGEHTYWKEVEVATGIPGAEPEIYYYRKADDGIYKIREKYRAGGEYLVAPLPLEPGKTWTVSEPDGSSLTYTSEFVESLPLASRTFENCMKLTISGTKLGRSIKGTVYRESSEGEVRGVLESSGTTMEYVLQPAPES